MVAETQEWASVAPLSDEDVTYNGEEKPTPVKGAVVDLTAAIVPWTFTIRGRTPILMHNPKGSLRPAQPVAPNKKHIPTPEEEATGGLYVMSDGSGRLHVPAEWVRQSLVSAGRWKKEQGRQSNLSTAVAAALYFSEMEFPLYRADGSWITQDARDWKLDLRPAQVNRGARVMRARPMIELPWQVTCAFDFDTTVLHRDTIEDFVRLAGLRCGIGDFRPEKKGWCGRFELIDSKMPQ